MTSPVLDDSAQRVRDAALRGPIPPSLNLALLGPVSFGVAIGSQCMMTALVRWGPIVKPVLLEMTSRGRGLALPEHDIPIYMAGLCGTMLLALAASWLWRRMFVCNDTVGVLQETAHARAHCSAALLGVLAAGSTIAFLVLLNSRFPFVRGKVRTEQSRLSHWILLLPAAAAIVCAAIDLRVGMARSPLAQPERSRISQRLAWIFDVVVGGLIVLCVFIPKSHWADLAGSFYHADELHHWNFFAIGPVLEFLHGKAFETDFYSQYGMGWPLTFVTLCPSGSFTVGRIVGIAIVYGCIYYIALYALLRLLLRNVPLAVSGVLLAILLQLFSGIDGGAVLWNFPSSTVLRHPADVWFFIALLMHRRTGKAAWIGAAGALAGVGIFYELDTGVYLPAMFAFYLTLCHLNGDSQRRGRYAALLARVVQFAVPFLLLLFVLLWLGTRGTLFHTAFCKGWIEGLKLQAFSGIGLLPFAGVDETGMLLFITMLAIHLLAVAWSVARHLARSASADDTLLGCIAAYGLAVLLVFVGRSHPYNLYHAAIPLAIVVMMSLNRVRRLAMPQLPRTSIPWALALGVALALWSKPQFLDYPSLAKSCMVGLSNDGPVALREKPKDISGLSLRLQRQCATLRAVAARMKRAAVGHKQVLVLDDNDTVLYYLSDVVPWSRYSSLWHCLYTKRAVVDIEREILSRQPAYIFIRAEPPAKWVFEDVWQEYHHFVASHYTLTEHVGMYEMWRLVA